jgi:hypothetical protein
MSSGNGSVKQPLVVVNGILTTIDGLKEINPERIKQVTVLKPEESSALYGSRLQMGDYCNKTFTKCRKERLEELYIKSIKALEKKPVQKEKDLPKAGQLTAGEINDFSKWEYWKDIAAPSLINTKRPKFYPDRRISVQLTNRNKKPVIGERNKAVR